MFYKLLAAAVVALLALFVLNMNEQAHADREARRSARAENKLRVDALLREGPAVRSVRMLEDGIVRVIEVPRRSLIGVELMTCALYVGNAGAAAMACSDDGTPVFD